MPPVSDMAEAVAVAEVRVANVADRGGLAAYLRHPHNRPFKQRPPHQSGRHIYLDTRLPSALAVSRQTVAEAH